RLLQTVGHVPLEREQVVEAPDEEQVSDLLDHFERVRDAAGPEGVPDAVNLVLDVAGDHVPRLLLVEVRKPLLQALHRGAPSGRRGLADRVPVTKKADLLHSSSSGTVCSHRIGTKYSQRSGSLRNSRW